MFDEVVTTEDLGRDGKPLPLGERLRARREGMAAITSDAVERRRSKLPKARPAREGVVQDPATGRPVAVTLDDAVAAPPGYDCDPADHGGHGSEEFKRLLRQKASV